MPFNSTGDLNGAVKTEAERIDDASREDHKDDGREATGPLSDEERLQMLGYDAVLGRPLGFWSSSAMNVCHNSFVFEFIAYTSLYAWPGPLLFVIGYPFLAILHFLLLGPFSELVSTFPVAGGMATWAWQCARHGIRGERQWGWLVSGMTLAMHMGKTIAYLYAVTTSLVQVYIITSGTKYNQLTGVALDPKTWWHPVFYVALISLVAILTTTRVARNSTFWTIAGAYNLTIAFLTFIMLIICATKVPKMNQMLIRPMDWGFPTRSQWIYGFSRMIFMGLPLRVTAIDCPVHMAEETKNPSRTVPRVMWATTILHFTMVYVAVTMFIVIVIPFSQGNGVISPVVPMAIIMGVGIPAIVAITCLATVCTITQVLASTVITSRFIFALARDNGIPFSKLLVKTSKHKEPWVAMTCLLASLYVSCVGWFVNRDNYYGLLQAFNFYFICIPYALPLLLYVTSHIDLRYVGRAEFSLGRFSRPIAWVVIAWLTLTTIQGSMPLTMFNGAGMYTQKKRERISFLPMVIAGMLLVMFASWWLYGRRHYVGPIRALTKWTTGVELDPTNLHSPNGRGDVVRQYIERKTGKTPPGSGNAHEPVTPVRPTFSGSGGKASGSPNKVLSSPGKTSPTLQRLLGLRSSSSKATRPASSEFGTSLQQTPMQASVLPESGIFPYEVQIGASSVVPESGIFPSQVDSLDDSMSAAQIESQLLPEERDLASRASRRMTFRPSVLTVGEQSYPLTDLTPPPRSQPTQLSPPPRTPKPRTQFQQPNWAAQEQSEQEPAALQESQLEPTQSFGELRALNESQIEPGHVESMYEPPALQESQLQPSWQVESFEEPAALQESQLEPRTY